MYEIDFGMRLYQLREQKNVSAREMSLSIGQNAGYINHIETGQGFPSLPVLLYICDYLGITPSAFFDLENKNPEKLSRITDLLKKLDDEQLELVEKLLKNMVKN